MAGKFTVAIQGLRALDGLAEKIGNASNDSIQRAAIEAAGRLANRVRDNVPVVTGDLKSRVQSGGFKKRTGQPIAAFVRMGSKGPGPSNLAALVEFGTVRAAPHPYFRPAVDESKSDILAALARGAAEGLKQL